MQSSAVYACVKVLSETIASLPLMVYKRKKDGGKEVATDHELYFLLHDMPNPFQTSFEFREMGVGHLSLRGNYYAFKEMTLGGEITKLWPLHPANMEVRKSKNSIIYAYHNPDTSKVEELPMEFVWHIRGLSSDGLVGLSPISLAREAIGIHLSQEEYSARLYSNFPRMGGAIKYPGTLTKEQADAIKEQFIASQTGDEAFKPAVLSGGLEWTAVGMNNVDAQFLESMNFSVEDIARIFRVPTVLIQHPDKTSTYASAEQFFLSFVTHTIRPWVVRIEQSINRCIFSERDRKKYFAEFKLDGLLRGDLESRYKAYAIGINTGWLCPNDVRELENLNRREDDEGDKFLRALNMGIAGEINQEEKGVKPNGSTE